MTDTLIKLFGSTARVKLLRLFLFNPQQSFTISEVTARTRIKKHEARREVHFLTRLKLLSRIGRGTHTHYKLNGESPYIPALQDLLLNARVYVDELYKRLRRSGTLQFIVAAGIFVGEWDSRLDLLVVGDRLKESTLYKSIRLLESEIGREIRFAWFPTAEFRYRLDINDHLVRDLFDYPHRVVYDRLDMAL